MTLKDDKPATDITHVAIWYDGKCYSLPKPNRHHHVIRMIAKENGIGIQGPDLQGFLDNNGKFLNRKKAFILATANNLILDKTGNVNSKELYSEDIW
jgi:hypothetical protein